MRAAFLLVLVGCYSPGYRDCEVTCGGGTCPSGFVCDQGVCRVEGFSGACGAGTMADAKVIDSSPDADDDGDRVLNKDDNCPTIANPTQNNEDRDARGDACDPCPVDDAAGADNDDDGDGVGNGCDPEPGQRNRIDVFEGFNGNAAPPGVTLTGMWTFSNGRAQSLASGPVSSLAWPGATTASEMVSAHFTITSLDATVGEQFIGVAPLIAAGKSPIRCSLETAAPGMLSLVNGTGRYGSTPMPGPVVVNQTAVTFSTRIDGAAVAPATNSNYVCAEAITGTTVSSPIALDATGTAQTGFYASGISATVDWIIIVSRAP